MSQSYFHSIVFFLFSLFALPSVFAQPVQNITLDSAIRIALENNREIRISEYDVNAAQSAVSEARGGFLPQINASGQYTRNIKKPVIFLPSNGGFPGGNGNGGGSNTIEVGYNNSYNLGINLNLPLYSRQLIKSYEAARQNERISETSLEQTENAVTGQTKRAFFTVLMSQELTDFTRQRIRNAREQLEDAKRQMQQGVISEYDVLVAEVQLENLRPELIQTENDLELSKLELKRILGIVDQDSIQVTGDLTPGRPKSIPPGPNPGNFLASNYQLQLLNQQRELMETNIDIQQAVLFPTLSAFGDYQTQSQDDTFDFSGYQWVNTASVGLNLQIPLFAGNTNRERITQSRIELRQAEEELQITEESLLTEYRSITSQIRQIIRRIEATERAVEQAERAYNIARSRFNQGLGTQMEINESELAYAQSQLNYLQAIYDYRITRTNLEELQGELSPN